MDHFPRTQLAAELVRALSGRQVFSDAPNGLFLAAPRRTGKSTFLQHDLRPCLEAQEVTVVYVDLWANISRDPGELIAEAIGKSLEKHLGLIARTAKAVGLESVTVAGVIKIDTSKIGKIGGASLPQALEALQAAAQAPVALIIDEAQHALTSKDGEAAMAALKSARDQLNAPGQVNLMLVMSGSDRDKLMRLVNSNAAPFFGSQIHSLPPLGADFVAHVADLIEAQRPDLRPVDRKVLGQALELFGARPQFFIEAIGQVLNPLRGGRGRFELTVLNAALRRQAEEESRMDSEFLALKPLEQAVLWRILEIGAQFRPYDAESLRFYSEKTGHPVTAARAQTALKSLRERTPPLVWLSAQDEYAAEDAAMHLWFTRRVAEGTWPPKPS
ncbi:hypothetical protein [Uliginosibacterium gangwonense]|uniref:hypothetical protein n=1 Tax=Uliginosibacterium gangwonense TaxID=392736 RepID=UPI00035F8C90|nr:hypothetical protein [Uliginosibacterium gangwonense]